MHLVVALIVVVISTQCSRISVEPSHRTSTCYPKWTPEERHFRFYLRSTNGSRRSYSTRWRPGPLGCKFFTEIKLSSSRLYRIYEYIGHIGKGATATRHVSDFSYVENADAMVSENIFRTFTFADCVHLIRFKENAGRGDAVWLRGRGKDFCRTENIGATFRITVTHSLSAAVDSITNEIRI